MRRYWLIFLISVCGLTHLSWAHDHAMPLALNKEPAYTEKSLYNLSSRWTTHTGKKMKLDVLRGKVRVVAMTYTHCEDSCPILVAQMKQIDKRLPDAARLQVGYVLISLDPQRDTPTVLNAYAQKMDLKSDSWTLLHGSAEDVLEVAVVFGMRYKKDQGGAFSHSNLLTVLNTEGEIVWQNESNKVDLEQALEVLKKLW